ncbi:alpha/beta fold hydrolase [Pseudoduganella violaceinigra]|uniref:alpha/beta fold hydrolase n=1 Tax=Pseudoduganella violaceinigra TaxID=246602 RepID=UPI00040BA7F0|nr:alpha/beta hydrolase [Pseudoduganella violaceinigra]
MTKTIKSALIAASLAAGATLVPAHAAEDTTVVLVHGAFADGSAWNKVIPILQKQGVKVVSVQNPLTSLADDAAFAQRVIDAQSGKVVLVGHSWGGAVITQAGASDKVKALVYVAAFAPSEGEVIGEIGKDFPLPPGIASLKPDNNGFIYLSAESMAVNFAQDLTPAEHRLMTATQGPIKASAFGDKVDVAAWKTKPSYYIVASKDRMIDPGLQKSFATKINAATTTLPSSHVPMASQPEAVAKVILAAVKR